MEIKLQNSVSGLSVGGLQKKSSTAAGTGGGNASSTYSVSVSPEMSLRLSEIKQRLLSEPSVDEARVTRIASAVQSGNYEINPRRAAEKLIAMEQKLPEFS